MKRFFDFNLLLSGLLVAAFAFTFTACSDDNDDDGGNSTDVPTYTEDAVKFEITDANSPYSSIELTANGEYIIIKGTSNAYNSAKGIKALVKAKENATAESSSNTINGTYTKNADGSYDLKNFGKITITANSISITTSNGRTSTYEGFSTTKVGNMESSLFRTWKAREYKLAIRSSEGNIDKTFKNFDEMIKWYEDGEGPDYIDPNEIWWQPTFENVIVSPYYTFAISAKEFKGNTFVTNVYIPMKWTRTGTTSGKITSVDNFPITFELKNNNLVLTYEESEDGETFKLTITYNPA